jgi:hypothetical protein
MSASSLYLTVLVIIYWALGLSQGHLQGGGSWGREGEARPLLELFKCSWLNLGASLTGSCGVRTGGLKVRVRFIGPGKVWLFQSQGLLGLAL